MGAVPPEWSLTTSTGLRFELTSVYDSPVFEQFYSGYDQAFVLPSEKEGRDGFEACFALNHGDAYARLSRQFGPFAEIALVASDVETGEAIGGADLLAMAFDTPSGRVVSSNLNYVFVDGKSRGRGYLRRILTGIFELVEGVFPSDRRPLVFIEQNDPFRMSAEAYRSDNAHSGTDQFDRLAIWAKSGARLVNFPYIQPGLSAEQGADDSLVYALLSPETPTLDPAILAEHLRRFFAISVLKGAPPRDDLVRAQLDDLGARAKRGEVIQLVDPLPLLAELAGRADRWSYWRDRPGSILEAALRRLPPV